MPFPYKNNNRYVYFDVFYFIRKNDHSKTGYSRIVVVFVVLLPLAVAVTGVTGVSDVDEGEMQVANRDVVG